MILNRLGKLEKIVNLHIQMNEYIMARDGSYIFPVVVTFKTSNRSNARVKQKVIRNKNVDEVLDVNTKIPGIPQNAVILEVGLGKSFIKKVG
jgi:hypothetical protein